MIYNIFILFLTFSNIISIILLLNILGFIISFIKFIWHHSYFGYKPQLLFKDKSKYYVYKPEHLFKAIFASLNLNKNTVKLLNYTYRFFIKMNLNSDFIDYEKHLNGCNTQIYFGKEEMISILFKISFVLLIIILDLFLLLFLFYL